MFTLKKENTVWWQVTISEPADGGKVVEHECDVLFELLSQDEYDLLAEAGDIKLLKRLIKGWKHISDANGHDLAFTKDTIDALLQIPFVRTGFLRSYMQAVSGAPVKN